MKRTNNYYKYDVIITDAEFNDDYTLHARNKKEVKNIINSYDIKTSGVRYYRTVKRKNNKRVKSLTSKEYLHYCTFVDKLMFSDIELV